MKHDSGLPEPMSGSKRKKLKYSGDAKHEEIAKQYLEFSLAPKYNLNSEEVYCTCRRPDHGGELMVSCDGCDNWFHFKCMGIDPDYRQLIDRFFCKFCEWQELGYTKWKRVCRKPGCLNPIRKEQKSKYCSDECGMLYMADRLKDLNALSRAEIKFLINFCKTKPELTQLGETFPELPEIANNELDKLPSDITLDLNSVKDKITRIEDELSYFDLKLKYLLKIKQKNELINSKLTEIDGSSEEAQKGKKKKSKAKTDLCYFDLRLYEQLPREVYQKALATEDVYESFKEEIDGIVEFYQQKDPETTLYNGKVCLCDRRKCLKHNGWWNLLADQLWKQLRELQEQLGSLEQAKQDKLRAYSINIYEQS